MNQNIGYVKINSFDYPTHIVDNVSLTGNLHSSSFTIPYTISIDSTEKVPNDAKTILSVDDKKDIIEFSVCDNGKKKLTRALIPDVSRFEVINNRVVIVYFCDGTNEKAVLSKEDTFSLEYGISICVTKKLLSMISNGNGSSVYNKLIDYFMNEYKNQVELKEWVKQEAEKIKQRKEKRIAKAKIKREKREQAIREEMIEIQKEAYIRAVKELNNGAPE